MESKGLGHAIRISISALALLLFVLSLLLLLRLSLQFKSIFALDLSHGLLTRVQVPLHLGLAFEGLLRQLCESFLDVDVVARRCLQKLHPLALTKLFRLGLFYCSLVLR